MHILVTNDDGVTAPGLLALAQEMRKLGKVTVLAPDRNWSASGHVKTMERPLRVRETKLADGSPALTTDGAPSDCVALALLGVVQEKVDLVVSGINYGENLGTCVTASGTVGAALQAAELGVPGLAVSLETDKAFHLHHGQDLDWSAAAAHFKDAIKADKERQAAEAEAAAAADKAVTDLKSSQAEANRLSAQAATLIRELDGFRFSKRLPLDSDAEVHHNGPAFNGGKKGNDIGRRIHQDKGYPIPFPDP